MMDWFSGSLKWFWTCEGEGVQFLRHLGQFASIEYINFNAPKVHLFASAILYSNQLGNCNSTDSEHSRISSTMLGRAVILTTHSMEECEALCSRSSVESAALSWRTKTPPQCPGDMVRKIATHHRSWPFSVLSQATFDHPILPSSHGLWSPSSSLAAVCTILSLLSHITPYSTSLNHIKPY